MQWIFITLITAMLMNIQIRIRRDKCFHCFLSTSAKTDEWVSTSSFWHVHLKSNVKVALWMLISTQSSNLTTLRRSMHTRKLHKSEQEAWNDPNGCTRKPFLLSLIENMFIYVWIINFNETCVTAWRLPLPQIQIGNEFVVRHEKEAREMKFTEKFFI